MADDSPSPSGALYAFTLLESIAGDHVTRPLSIGDLWASDYSGTPRLPSAVEINEALDACNYVVGAAASVAADSVRDESPWGSSEIDRIRREALRVESRVRVCCRLLMRVSDYDGKAAWFPELREIDQSIYQPLLSDLRNPAGFLQSRRTLSIEFAEKLVEDANSGHLDAIKEIEEWSSFAADNLESGLVACESLKIFAMRASAACLAGRKAGTPLRPPNAYAPEPSVPVFVSYRREDSNDFTARLCSELGGDGRVNVMLDIDSIQLGVDFRDAIKGQIEKAQAVLVIIGSRWLGASREDGTLRLLDQSDAVRVEVETALALGKRLIPVLAGDARMPTPGELPDSLADLCFRNGISIRHESFARDVSALARQLAELQSVEASS